MTLEEKHLVSKALQAFQQVPEPKAEPLFPDATDETLSPFQDAKVNRDVDVLNKCIEDVENFVVLLKRINEARKQRSNKKLSKKKKTNDILVLQAQAPPENQILEVFQKFKYSLNLCAKLNPHLTNPNAQELIHYIFVPLNIITKVTGLEKPRGVVSPLLTNLSCDLLKKCLDSQEYHFWQSLGTNWTLTKTSDMFADKNIPPYTPTLK
jgi:epidermal growth factor receptor kinase substrate 8